MSDDIRDQIRRASRHPKAELPRWGNAPIYRMVGGPFDGLLRELEPPSNAVTMETEDCRTVVYTVEGEPGDQVLQYRGD